MPQTSEHRQPVVLAFVGVATASALMLANVVAHEERWAHFLTLRVLRSDVLLPLAAPAAMLLEGLAFTVLARFDVTGFADNSPTENCLFLATPVLPLLLVAVACRRNIGAACAGSPGELLDAFLPHGGPQGERPRYRGVLWLDVAALIAAVAFALPWALHLLGWEWL
jgi:hypothetical protein